MININTPKIAYIISNLSPWILDEILELKKNNVEVYPICISYRENTKKFYDVLNKEQKALEKEFFYPRRNREPKLERVLRRLSYSFKGLLYLVYRDDKNIRNWRKFKDKEIYLEKGVLEYLKVNKVTHIHTHFAASSALLALLIKKKTGISFSFTAHAADIFIENDYLRDLIREAKFVVAISQYNKQFILNRYGAEFSKKINVNYLGVRLEDNTKNIFNKTDGILKIISASWFTEKKGLVYLIEALKKLKEQNLKFKVEIYGEGSEKNKIISFIKESELDRHVFVRPSLERDSLKRKMLTADVFVLPCVVLPNGDRDGIPVVLMEAMSVGLPVISTNISGIPELVEDGRDGLLCGEKDAACLADKLLFLNYNHSVKTEISSRSIKKIKEKFNLEKNVPKLAEMFKEINKS